MKDKRAERIDELENKAWERMTGEDVADKLSEEEAKKLFWEGETRGVTENGSSIIESSLEINEDKE